MQGQQREAAGSSKPTPGAHTSFFNTTRSSSVTWGLRTKALPLGTRVSVFLQLVPGYLCTDEQSRPGNVVEGALSLPPVALHSLAPRFCPHPLMPSPLLTLSLLTWIHLGAPKLLWMQSLSQLGTHSHRRGPVG